MQNIKKQDLFTTREFDVGVFKSNPVNRSLLYNIISHISQPKCSNQFLVLANCNFYIRVGGWVWVGERVISEISTDNTAIISHKIFEKDGQEPAH